jgi:hypothetical protein
MASRIVLVLALLLAAAGCSSSDDQPKDSAVPRDLTAVVSSEGGYGAVVRVDPTRLRPLPSPRVPLGRLGGPWVLSPDRSRVAVSTPSGVRLVDLAKMRAVGDVSTGLEETLALAWPMTERLLLAGRAAEGRAVELVAIDLPQRRVLARHRLPGFVVDDAAGSGDLELLMARIGTIGPCRLVVLDVDGRLRLRALSRIPCGVRTRAVGGGLTVDRSLAPGLVSADDRSFVVSQDDLIVEVEHDGLRVDYHELREETALLGRILDWLVPAANAKGLSEGWVRDLLWLDRDRLAVYGWNEHAARGPHGWEQRESPASLRLVDTSSWMYRTIDADASIVLRAGDLLLAFGTSYSTSSGRFEGDGLRTYTLSGSRRLHLFPGRPVWDVQVADGRAYVSFEGSDRNATIDLSGGGVLAVFEDVDPPSLLGGGRDLTRG